MNRQVKSSTFTNVPSLSQHSWHIRPLAVAIAVVIASSRDGQAAPTDGQLVSGSLVNPNLQGAINTIEQTSDRAVINWNSFGVQNGETVSFKMPNANAAVLNRVTGTAGSLIEGALNGNGRVYLVNPNGIVVGAGGVINVTGGFIASTQGVSDADAKRWGNGETNDLTFSGNSSGRIQVLGTIKSAEGDIVLIAPKTEVGAGAELTAGKAVRLIAANEVRLSNGKFTVVPKSDDEGQITMEGAIQAAQVQLEAHNQNLAALAINTKGTIRATGTQTNPDGSVSIVAAGAGGNVKLEHTQISAQNADGNGGKIDVTGQTVSLQDTTLDATGSAQGGQIRVGGGFKGQDTDLANAHNVVIDTDSVLDASAKANTGNGGTVAVWADDTTEFNGTLKAAGGAEGKGGQAEISGKRVLKYDPKHIDLSGAQYGDLLLDPADVCIGTMSGSCTSNWTQAAINTSLNGANLTIDANALPGLGNGDIFINQALVLNRTSGQNRTLTLTASRNINVDLGISDVGAGSTNLVFNGLNLVSGAGSNTTIQSKGDITVNTQKVTVVNGLTLTAKNIVLGNSLSEVVANNVAMNAASGIDGWQNQEGRIRFDNAALKFSVSGSLRLRSGLEAGNTGNRTDFGAGLQINAPGGAMTGAFELLGFKSVSLDEALTASSITVRANDINVTQNLSTPGSLVLEAAAWDYGFTSAVNRWSGLSAAGINSGWQNLDGWLSVNNGVTLSAGAFNLFSGVKGPGQRTGANARTDLPTGVTLQRFNGAPVSELIVQGFRDVTLPSDFTSVGSGRYYVTARNITGTNLPNNTTTLQAGTLRLIAGAFADDTTGTNPVNRYQELTLLDNPGVLRLPTELSIRADSATLSSGQEVGGNGRTDLVLKSYTSNSTTSRSRTLSLQGFKDVFTPVNDGINPGVSAEDFWVRASNIIVRGDLAGGLTQIKLQAGNFDYSSLSPLTGSGKYTGPGFSIGKITFNKPDGSPVVVRMQSGGLFQAFNGTSPADFTGVQMGYAQYAGANDNRYVATTTGSWASTRISGFDNIDLKMTDPSQVWVNSGAVNADTLSINLRNGSSGAIRFYNHLSTASVNRASGFLNDFILNAGSLGAIYGGDKVLSGGKGQVFVGQNSSVNLDADLLDRAINNRAGASLVINEANNLVVKDLGINGAGHIEINARGELTVDDVNRSSLTLHADAAIGRTLTPNAIGSATPAYSSTDLNPLFANANADQATADGRTTELGGDGYGAVSFAGSQPLLVLPLFRAAYVVEADNFRVPSGNTYYTANGTALAANALVARGTVVYADPTTGPALGIDNLTDNGNPIRLVGEIRPGGYTVDVANAFYNADGNVYRVGDTISSGTTVYYKPGTPVANLSQVINRGGWAGSGKQVYAVTGYSQAPRGIINYQSLGLATTAGNSWTDYFNSGSYTQLFNTNLAASTLTGDTPVSATGSSYYGNPANNTNNTLNLSGQWFTWDGNYQAAPTRVNELAANGGKDSLSGNGWDIGYNTANVTTTGDLTILSGARHAITTAEFVAGDAADMNIFTNPAIGNFNYAQGLPANQQPKAGAVKIRTTGADGNLTVLGYRDIVIHPQGVMSSNGNVTLGAARDLKINENLAFDGANRLTTLIAGHMIKTADNKTVGTVGNNDLMLIAGHGVDVNARAARIAGSIQDRPALTGVLAGSDLTANHAFRVNNTGALTVDTLQVKPLNQAVSGFSNQAVTNVTLTDIGLQLAPSGLLNRSGVNTTNGEEINLKSSGNLTVNADISTAGNAFVQGPNVLQGVSGTINADRLVVSADTNIGASGNRLRTNVNTLAINGSQLSTGSAFIREANAVSVMGKTSNNGNIDVVTDDGTITTIRGVDINSGLATANAQSYNAQTFANDSIHTNGSGAIRLTAGGAISDIQLAGTVRAESGNINLDAGRNITDNIVGELGHGTDTSASANLNIATSGDINLLARNTSVGSIGGTGDGVTPPDALEIWGRTITSDSRGTTNSAGTYLNILDTLGSLSTPSTVLGVSSGKNIDITSRASTTPNTGSLTVGAQGLTSANNGYIRVAADRDLTINAAVDADGTGNIIMTAGLIGNGSLVQNAVVTTDTGEINLRALDNMALNQNVTTGGSRILAQAVNGGISTNGTGRLTTGSGGGIGLTAGTTIGSATNRIKTSTDQLSLTSSGDQYFFEADAVTLFAKTTNNGRIDGLTDDGSMTIADFADLLTTITGTTGGVTTLAANGSGSGGVNAHGTGAVVLKAQGANSDLIVNQTVQSGTGEVNLKAGRDVLQAANISTGGNAFIEASRDIARTGSGKTGAIDLVLTAGRNIGSSISRMFTNVTRLALNGSQTQQGNAFVQEDDAVTLSAKTANAGSIDVATNNGGLTVDRFSVASSQSNAASYSAPIDVRTGIDADANGSVTLTANGAASDVLVNQDVVSDTGTLRATAQRNVQFNAGQMRTDTSTGQVFVTASDGAIINNANVTGATRQQIVAQKATLNANTGIGSGIIDNTKTGVDNLLDLNLDVDHVAVNNRSSGNVALWNTGAIEIDGANTPGYFGINAGGRITQLAGTTLGIDGNAEFDTMRDTSIGQVDLKTRGNLNTGGSSYVGGDFNATSETADINIGGVINARGTVKLTGQSIVITGTINQGGDLIQNGQIVTRDGATIASLVITGNQAVITASGSSATFDLNSVLTPSVLAGLPGNVTQITVNLGNRIVTYTPGDNLPSAIELTQNNNRVVGQFTVRTGDPAISDPTIQTRNYHLVDAAGSLDFGSKNVVVNAARGTSFAAGSQVSSVAAQASALNTQAGFDVTTGSNVTFTRSKTTGTWDVRDAYDTKIASAADVNVAYLYTNRDATLLADPNGQHNLNLQGNVRAGQHLIGVAGLDVNLASGANISAGRRLTLVVDEAAGTQAGAGWFRNNGATVSSDENNIAIYAVAGGVAPAGYIVPSSQTLLGTIGGLTENQPLSHWNTPYQTDSGGTTGWGGFAADGNQYVAGAGHFSSPALWYKVLAQPDGNGGGNNGGGSGGSGSGLTGLVPVLPNFTASVDSIRDIAGSSNPVILWPISFGLGVGEAATAAGEGGTEIAYSCDSWSQRESGNSMILSVLKPTFLGLRHSKTDNLEALDNGEGEVKTLTTLDSCSQAKYEKI